MSIKLLQIDFACRGPFKDDMSLAFEGLAKDIATEPGLLWKIWTENESTQRAGGWYAFDSLLHLENYLAKHTERLTSFGLNDIQYQIFDANIPLSSIDHFPVSLLKTS